MKAFEFDSVIEDGVIHVPEQYIKNTPFKVRVIVLSEDTITTSKPCEFNALQLHTSGFHFDRELANE